MYIKDRRENLSKASFVQAHKTLLENDVTISEQTSPFKASGQKSVLN
jgi:hypothetical protein